MNCSALSAHLIFGKRAASKCQKTNARVNHKVSPFVMKQLNMMALDTKNQTIKIEKAFPQYLFKPREATIRPCPVVNNNPENQDVFIRNIPGNKSYAQATVPSNSARTSNNVVIFGGSIVNFSTKLKYNINRALTNGRARFKYFPGATSKELLHYIDATLEENNFEVTVIHVRVNDLLNSNNSVDKLLKNIYTIAEKCKSSGVKNVFISAMVKNNRINDFIIQEVNRKIYDDCQKEDYSFIINDGIGNNDLFKDGLHLLVSGKQNLANKFVFNTNSF